MGRRPPILSEEPFTIVFQSIGFMALDHVGPPCFVGLLPNFCVGSSREGRHGVAAGPGHGRVGVIMMCVYFRQDRTDLPGPD